MGCFVSDGGSALGGVTPWPDGSGNWKSLNWAQCKEAARNAGLNSFAMEGSAGYAQAGVASCGHVETIQHDNYHDAGHNGQGRAPDSDCALEQDTEGHLLGGPFRYAMYAPASVATCVQDAVGAPATGAVHNVDECAGPDYTQTVDGNWMMVGCFVSDQDGNSHADPWASGDRWVDTDWDGCRQKAVDENSPVFVMEMGQGYAQQGHASCGHMNKINHGNFHVSSDSDAEVFQNTMGASHPGDTGHNGYGRAPLSDCSGEIDDAGHALGGPWRFAVYAQQGGIFCSQLFSGAVDYSLVLQEFSPET